MSQDIFALMRSVVRDRARGWCEYCLLHEDDARTAVGRVTEFLLQLNRADRLRVRRVIATKRLYPR